MSDFNVIQNSLRDKAVDVVTRDAQFHGTVVGLAGMGLLMNVEAANYDAGKRTMHNPAKLILITWATIETVEVKS